MSKFRVKYQSYDLETAGRLQPSDLRAHLLPGTQITLFFNHETSTEEAQELFSQVLGLYLERARVYQDPNYPSEVYVSLGPPHVVHLLELLLWEQYDVVPGAVGRPRSKQFKADPNAWTQGVTSLSIKGAADESEPVQS